MQQDAMLLCLNAVANVKNKMGRRENVQFQDCETASFAA